MWEIGISFEDSSEHEIIIRGEENDIPLWTALKYYNLFLECEGKAEYRQNTGETFIPLERKILMLTELNQKEETKNEKT